MIVNQNVFKLDISMDDPILMKIIHCFENLLYYVSYIILLKCLV